MATYNKFQDFAEQLLKGTHQFGTHTFKAAFTNVAPSAANSVLADITQISAGGGYASGGVVLDTVVVSETAGTAKVTVADEVFTASGTVGPFRYVVLYNDTSASDNLICWYDYGSSITLSTGESFTIDFDGTNGLFQVA